MTATADTVTGWSHRGSNPRPPACKAENGGRAGFCEAPVSGSTQAFWLYERHLSSDPETRKVAAWTFSGHPLERQDDRLRDATELPTEPRSVAASRLAINGVDPGNPGIRRDHVVTGGRS